MVNTIYEESEWQLRRRVGGVLCLCLSLSLSLYLSFWMNTIWGEWMIAEEVGGWCIMFVFVFVIAFVFVFVFVFVFLNEYNMSEWQLRRRVNGAALLRAHVCLQGFQLAAPASTWAIHPTYSPTHIQLHLTYDMNTSSCPPPVPEVFILHPTYDMNTSSCPPPVPDYSFYLFTHQCPTTSHFHSYEYLLPIPSFIDRYLSILKSSSNTLTSI